MIEISMCGQCHLNNFMPTSKLTKVISVVGHENPDFHVACLDFHLSLFDGLIYCNWENNIS